MVWHIRRGWRDDHAEIENAIMLGAFKQTTEMFHGFLSNRNCESCGQTSDTIVLNIEIEIEIELFYELIRRSIFNTNPLFIKL